MSAGVSMKWDEPGPVALAFANDRSEVSAIMGPQGSGKTSTVLQKFVRMCAEQAKSPRDGKRYTKVGVVRETQTNLKRTTIKSIKNWFGKKGRWYGGGASMEPLSFEVQFKLPDQSIAVLVFEFIGLDGANIEDLAKGWEITHYWLNEGDLLDPEVKTFLDARIGRYPAKIDGGCTHYCGVIDFNAPDTENYLYKLFEEDKPEGHKLFKQPGGRSPNAENIQNLPAGYYERMVRGKEKWWIRRNIDSQYGFSREGDPVYEDYRDDFHCASYDLMPVDGLPLVVYCDAALHPAAVFTQTMPNGQRRILDEVYLVGGAVQLGEAIRSYAAKKWPDHKFDQIEIIGGYVDPSAGKRSDNDIEDDNWIEKLNRTMNLKGAKRFRAAPTNDPSMRQDAVKNLLTGLVDGGQPMLLISPAAKITRKGFNSDYRFKKRANGDREDRPEKKHPVSDVHDAIQYFALDEGGYEEVSAKEVRKRHRMDSSKPKQAKMAVKLW